MTAPATNGAAGPDTASSLHGRLIRGFGASALGPVVTVIIQFVSVPVFLHFWGAKLYGEWLILSAIPSYLALSDFGFGSVAANDMTMQAAKGDRQGALQTFQSAWALTSGISLLVATISAVLVSMLPFARWLHLTVLTHAQIPITLFILVAYVLFGFQSNMIAAGFRCDGNFALGVLLANIFRLAETSAVIVAVAAHGSSVAAALALLGMRIFGNIYMQTVLRKKTKWLHYGFSHATWSVVRRLFHPAIAYMAFPAGNALSFQGILLAVGAMLGPVAVVVFSTLRTMARFATQLMVAIQSGVWPELSRAHGASNRQVVRDLHRYCCQASVWITGTAAIGLAVFGNRILMLWTHGKVAMDTPVFLTLLLVAVVNSLWSSSVVALLATNQHERAAVVYLIATAISLPAACLLMHAVGLVGAALAMLGVDLVCAGFVVQHSLALVEDAFVPFCASLVRCPPALRARFFTTK